MPSSDGRKEREIQYRDGLIIAVLSLWPIRRRSLAALTLGRHVKISDERADILLFREDTKAGRARAGPCQTRSLPYLLRYLSEIRPFCSAAHTHDALWVGQRGNALSAGAYL